RNFFRFYLWKFYSEYGDNENIREVATAITKDPFVNEMDYQRVNISLASGFFEENNYSLAITHFEKADRFLTINNPIYYHQYAICLLETKQTVKALEILQRLVLNNIDNVNVAASRYLIIDYWMDNNRVDDALDILLQVPVLKRTDEDFRALAKIYMLQLNSEKAKNSVLFIKNKTVEDQQLLANLHLLTGDEKSAETTWQAILTNSQDTANHLNSYAGLGYIFYQEEKYTEANKYYDEYFKIYNKNTSTQGILIQPIQTLKEHIIACLMTNNRPKAESMQKNFAFLINNDHDFLAEIKLYEGIYYIKMDPKKAERPLTQVIEDGKISAELAYKALYYRGTLNMQEKKPAQAETDLLSALYTSDQKLKNQVCLKLGTLYYNQEKFEEALEYYYAVITHDREGDLAKDAAHNFAITARTIQQWNIAIAAYQIIMDRWGQSHLETETKLTIGFSFYMAKEYDQAINLLEQLFPDLQTTEHRAEAQFWIAESLLKKGEYEKAEEGFKKIKTTYRVARWIELADLKIAETYIYRGDKDRGKILLQEVIRVQGAASDAGKEATRILKEIE
ncbi:MAG: tetratricopeptide repeat protein, partial [Candidatus Cloacimonetes bacterium]|nr:tetratricopeptide repeat protein [Candidatus Cloacimonadota bacterium]